MKQRIALLAAAAFAAALAVPAVAADTVKIGALYPLTGNSAPAGQAAKAGGELGVDVVNTAHPSSRACRSADRRIAQPRRRQDRRPSRRSPGRPVVGQQQALRLITQEHVAALLGVLSLLGALTATAVAERYGVPFVVGEQRRRQHHPARLQMDLPRDAHRHRLRRRLCRVPERAEIVRAEGRQRRRRKREHRLRHLGRRQHLGSCENANIKVAAQIAYNANSSDVSAQVLQLKSRSPTWRSSSAIPPDIILYFKTMKDLDYLPPMIIGDDAGFSDPSFIPDVGDLAQGAINRSAWESARPAASPTASTRCTRRKDGPRPRRHQRALDAGLPGVGRCHQPRRLDRSGKAAEGAAKRPI